MTNPFETENRKNIAGEKASLLHRVTLSKKGYQIL